MATILIAEDDEALRRMLSLTLASWGHEVVQAGDGEAALAVCESRAIDLVLTDLIMPEKEGLETIRELRRRQPALKIIAMSGDGEHVKTAGFLKVAKHLGALKTLVKPFTSKELAAAVSAVLEG